MYNVLMMFMTLVIYGNVLNFNTYLVGLILNSQKITSLLKLDVKFVYIWTICIVDETVLRFYNVIQGNNLFAL
jgi:hypothetical protein